jgi:gamma-carbonic anhydrase
MQQIETYPANLPHCDRAVPCILQLYIGTAVNSTPEIYPWSCDFLERLMGPPSLFQRVRHTLGRALRETGQALDRLGVQGETLARSKRVNGDEPVLYEDFLSRHRHQMPLLRRGRPRVSKDVAFLAPCSTLIGSVQVGAGSSIWYKAILRADNCENSESLTMIDDEYQMQEPWELDPERERRQNSKAIGGGIFIGENTNIQDGCIIDAVKNHTRIGNGVTVGHLASIHSATVHDYCLIGMGSLLQEGVEVKSESLIAAGANVPANTVIESGELWVGSPARKIRDLTPEERQRLHYQSSEVSVRIGRNSTRMLVF